MIIWRMYGRPWYDLAVNLITPLHTNTYERDKSHLFTRTETASSFADKKHKHNTSNMKHIRWNKKQKRAPYPSPAHSFILNINTKMNLASHPMVHWILLRAGEKKKKKNKLTQRIFFLYLCKST